MDELIKAYFQHVHPILPVVDEADFGSAYYQPTANRSITHVSVLLLQGMLFAACNVSKPLPRRTLQIPNSPSAVRP